MEEKKTTYTKGKDLEYEFAKFLKDELNYEKVRVGYRVKGHTNPKGTEVDIIAERLDKKGKDLKKMGIIYYFLGAILIFTGIYFGIENNDDLGIIFIIIGFIAFIGTFVLLAYSKKFNIENAWVECKNLKGKVNINQISKVIREKDDYIDTGDTELKIKDTIFVSTNGYIENALKYAIKSNIICYEKDNKGKFIKSEYWS